MSDPVGVALAGYGYWGANLARNIQASSTTTLVGVVEPDPAQQEAASRTYPGITTWFDLEGALQSPDVEAVVLATPAGMHGDMAVATLRSGRHVMVEKPLAATVAEAEAIVAVAAETGRVAMVGHTFLYSPPVRMLKELVDTGELGDVQYLYSQRLSLGRIRRDCNALWNFAPHDISIMLYLLGALPAEVSGRGFSFIEPPIDDVCFASLTFPSGVGANLHVSWIDPRKTRLMTVVGSEKMAIYNDVSADQKIWIFDAGVARSANPSFGEFESLGEFQWRTRAGDIIIPKVDMREPLLVELEAFGEACRSGLPTLSDASNGLDVVRVLAAIDDSVLQGGAPVRLDP
jgi:predicted dehydrogenase